MAKKPKPIAYIWRKQCKCKSVSTARVSRFTYFNKLEPRDQTFFHVNPNVAKLTCDFCSREWLLIAPKLTKDDMSLL